MITVGVGLGVGEGVGVGVGVGVGDCACAADMMPMSTNMIATSRAQAWPIPIFRARESCDEQHMQSIPKGKSAGPKNAQIPINRNDLPPVRRKGQSVSPRRALEYASLLFGCHSPRDTATQFPARARTLRTAKFRVAIRGAIGFRPFDCAFREQEI
ncbi:hypothetical protein ACF1BQ_016615 [Bradyrhizobium sp. RDT10]